MLGTLGITITFAYPFNLPGLEPHRSGPCLSPFNEDWLYFAFYRGEVFHSIVMVRLGDVLRVRFAYSEILRLAGAHF